MTGQSLIVIEWCLARYRHSGFTIFHFLHHIRKHLIAKCRVGIHFDDHLLGKWRSQTSGFFEILQGAFGVSVEAFEDAALAERLTVSFGAPRVVPRQPDGFLQILHRTLSVAVETQCLSTIVVSCRAWKKMKTFSSFSFSFVLFLSFFFFFFSGVLFFILFFSRMHATLCTIMSIRWLVGRLVTHLRFQRCQAVFASLPRPIVYPA